MRDDRAPLIGITTYGPNSENRFHLPVEYVEAIRRAGGIATLMPPGETRLPSWLERIDALVLAGGGDIDPALYQGQPHAALEAVDRSRDEGELELVRAALDQRRPLLCICRGMQILNVALGGTLHADLPSLLLPDALAHRAGPGKPLPHAVRVERESRLAGILGATRVQPQSHHHQALDHVAPGLQVVARAPDGIIEAVEVADHPELIAVQWHPELSSEEDLTQQRLFLELVRRAREQRAQDPSQENGVRS